MEKILSPVTFLDQVHRIVITTHHNPDGDAVGSALGLKHYLEQKGKICDVIISNDIPAYLHFLPGVESIHNFEQNSQAAKQLFQAADLLFCLDYNNFSRTNDMESHLRALEIPKVMIDHHLFPEEGFTYGISEPDRCSTCELVFEFIEFDNGLPLLNETIAECLYTGILTDSGSFRYPSVNGRLHNIVAALLETGLKHELIHQAIYDSASERRLKFLGHLLSNCMTIFPKYNTGLISVSLADQIKFKVQPGDTEGFVNYPLSIQGITFATMITEKQDYCRLSFRSQNDFDVNQFARTYFNGGGHANASGGKSTENFQDTIQRFNKIISEIHPL